VRYSSTHSLVSEVTVETLRKGVERTVRLMWLSTPDAARLPLIRSYSKILTLTGADSAAHVPSVEVAHDHVEFLHSCPHVAAAPHRLPDRQRSKPAAERWRRRSCQAAPRQVRGSGSGASDACGAALLELAQGRRMTVFKETDPLLPTETLSFEKYVKFVHRLEYQREFFKNAKLKAETRARKNQARTASRSRA